jgi:hypothetical protein
MIMAISVSSKQGLLRIQHSLHFCHLKKKEIIAITATTRLGKVFFSQSLLHSFFFFRKFANYIFHWTLEDGKIIRLNTSTDINR